jgi:hypothetical protein
MPLVATAALARWMMVVAADLGICKTWALPEAVPRSVSLFVAAH